MKRLKCSGVYKIKNIINNECYYGSSNNINRRWAKHKKELNENCHCNDILQNAWNKYGESTFIFEYVILCDVSTYEKRKQAEEPFLLKGAYNICKFVDRLPEMKGENHWNFGKRHMDSTKLKISNTLQKLYEDPINHPSYGKEWSEESKQKMRKPKSEEAKRKMSESHKGKTPWNKGGFFSEESRQKMSIAKRGKRSTFAKFTDDEIRNIRSRFLTGETKSQLSKSLGVSFTCVRNIVSMNVYKDVN